MSTVADALEGAAAAHLWPHFTRMGEVFPDGLPIIEHGEDCYLTDTHGRRYLDALAGLFCVQIGYSHGEEMGQAALTQMRELPFYTNWSYAHPRSVELAERLAELAPPELQRCFFVNGGSEAVETAWKLARAYHAARGERRWKAISRQLAYHGSTLGALAITGVPGIRTPFEPLTPSVSRLSHTGRLRRPEGETESDFTSFLLRELSETIEREGPETVAMVIIEPVQNSGGAFTPPAGYLRGVREICDAHGVLLVADEVITGFGRLGDWFASNRYQIEPDLITCAKGLSSAYGAIGAVIASERVAEHFLHGAASFAHGITFGGHPVQAALALKNLEIIEREQLNSRVRRHEHEFKTTLEPLLELPIVGELRGDGYFWALELVRDRDSCSSFTSRESEHLLRGFLSRRLLDAGLICRADDRGEPVIQVSPPLVAGTDEFQQIAGILGDVLGEASSRVARGNTNV